MKTVFDTIFFQKEQIAWENGTKTVYDIYSCCPHLASWTLSISQWIVG